MFNYHNRKNKNNWWLAVFTILGIFLVVVLSGWGRSFFTDPFIFFTKPFWQAGDKLGTTVVNQVANLGLTRQDLLIENKKLREENNQLKILISAKKSIETDNLKLRAILGKKSDEPKPSVALVIFLPNFIPYNNLLLDVGKKNSTQPLKSGDLVVADGAVLVGRIVEVDDFYSKAKLVSAESNLSVTIGEKNVPAMATGSGVGNFTITLPKDVPISVGDQVSAPLLGNYLIGSVGHIEKLTSRPTQTVLVRTPVNLFQLKWVEIYDTKI